MPEPPRIIIGGGHAWDQRTDGPSSVAINGYNAMVMYWVDKDKQLQCFVCVGVIPEDPEVNAYALFPPDPRLPYWASWRAWENARGWETADGTAT